LPFPTNQVLSSIGASLLSTIVPTESAAKDSFLSSIQGAVPTGVNEKSRFVASITSEVGRASDAVGFSSRLSSVLADVTASAASAMNTSQKLSATTTTTATKPGATTTGTNSGAQTIGAGRAMAASAAIVVSVIIRWAL
jgi:hypothetical protein